MAQSRTTVDPAEAIIAALAQLGQATAADIATAAGLAYSTTTRNLRELAAAGRVEKVADGKQSQWRLPTAASPRAEAGTETGAEPGALAHTQAGAQAGMPASSLSTVESTHDAARPSETAADAAAPADTSPAEAIDGPADTADTADHAAGNAAADDSGPDASAPNDGNQDNSAQDNSACDDRDASRADHGEDGVHADRADDVVAGEPPAGTDTHAAVPDTAGPDNTEEPDGAGTGGPTTGTPAQTGGTAKPRRASGTLDGAVLDILEAHPGRAFKVSELCKLIDAANAGQDVSKASPGAVVLACQRLVTRGKAILAVEKPATFGLVPADTTSTAAVEEPTASTTGR